MERKLSAFEAGETQKRGVRFALWWLLQNLGFKSFLFPSNLRVSSLRLFGAKIGNRVIIRRGVRVHMPWNLEIGDHCWIGEDAWFINHEKITIGSNVCISQAAIICSSGHDFRSPSLAYKHKPVTIEDGAWICLRATVLAGSHIDRNSVISAGEVFTGNLPANHLFVGGASKPIEGMN